MLGPEEALVIAAMTRNALERLQASERRRVAGDGQHLAGGERHLSSNSRRRWRRSGTGSGSHRPDADLDRRAPERARPGPAWASCWRRDPARRGRDARGGGVAGERHAGLDIAAGLVGPDADECLQRRVVRGVLARPHTGRTRWLDALPAALVVTVLFAIGRYLIAAYLTHAGVASAYGAAGSLAAVLVWCYASAQIFLYGACVLYVQTRRDAPPPHTEPSP